MSLADWHELLGGWSVALLLAALWLLMINYIHRRKLRALQASLDLSIARNDALVAEISRRHQAMREAMALWNYGAFDEAVDTLEDGGWDVKVRP